MSQQSKPPAKSAAKAPQLNAEELQKSLEEMRVALEKAEAANRKKDEEIEAMRETAGLKYDPKAQPMTGEAGGWLFEIEPLVEDKPELSHLKPVKARACDESELKRWYCFAHEMTPGSGKAVDPLKVRFRITCLEASMRAKEIMTSTRIGALKQKLKVGAQLSQTDQELLEQFEDRVWRIPKVEGIDDVE